MVNIIKYTPELQERADQYVDGGFAEECEAIPTKAGLALYLGISEGSVVNYKRKYPAFKETCDRLKTVQHCRTLNRALLGEVNAKIASLILGNYGYSEKSSRELTGKDGGPLEVDGRSWRKKLRAESGKEED